MRVIVCVMSRYPQLFVNRIFHIFIVIALDKAIFLAAIHFSVNNIGLSSDHGGRKGGANVNVIQLVAFVWRRSGIVMTLRTKVTLSGCSKTDKQYYKV